MTHRTTVQEGKYLAAFDSFQRNGAVGDPEWIHQLREAAIARFNVLGFPVARRGNEEWKYTDIRPIAATNFQPATGSAQLTLPPPDVDRLTFGNPGWSRIVFVDGVYSQELSALTSLPAGVSVVSLAQALVTHGDMIKQHMARYAPYESEAFTALNTAFAHDGALVQIADGAIAEEPVHLLFLTTGRQQDTVTYPRVLILTGKDSKATVIESYGSLDEGRYFTNAVTEVRMGSGSVLNYYKVQRQSQQAFHVSNTNVSNASGASFNSVNLDLGGGLVRNNLNVLMGEEGCSCVLNGLYLLNGTQHVDNQVIIDHTSSYTTASELYKGILDGKSHSVFHGSIIVRKGIQKVNANQVDKNLLLSDQAEADTKPAFWIYSDDVKCGHGAACGQMDENALFYLKSRGMDDKLARRVLTRAFATQVIDSIGNGAFRAAVGQIVENKLEEWLEAGESR
ncbi:MAG: Fe-S cluster assembly protein SufD [Dehalococcoidia bacterium]|nr:Fe-S cluster assembly protein SufD [Dehalococcoidia bacterium]